MSRSRFLGGLALACAAFAFAAGPALAADPSVDLRPLLEPVLGLLGAALMTLALWAVQRVAAWAGVAIEGERRQALALALEKAIGYGINRVATATADKPLTVPIAIPVLAEALNRLLPSVPEALAHFEITPAKAVRMLISRLPAIEGAFTDSDIDKIVAMADARRPA